MKRIWFAALIACLAASAEAAPASVESVEQLLAVTRAESLIDTMYAGIEQNLRLTMQQVTRDKTLDAEQQRVIDEAPARLMAIMKQELNWATLRPRYVKLYRDSFEQEEVDGLLVFYRSPAGQALVNKMPVVVQKSFAMSQALMQALSPKLMAAMQQTMSEAKIGN